MKVAVVGATGMVGQVMLQVLAERDFPVTELLPVASESSVGKEMQFRGKTCRITDIARAVRLKPQLALFSAGSAVSLEWAPRFAEAGTTVIDNSSAWRTDASKKLIVPEINASLLTEADKIIANPNCSTIQMVMVLAPLHQKYQIKRVVVSTYQSVTGTGVKALQQLENEALGIEGAMAYPHPVHKNAIPQCDVFEENGYTREEMKLVRETQKILNDATIAVTATAVRIPVVGGHSEAVNVEFVSDFTPEDIRQLLRETPGVTVQDDPAAQTYPMPASARGTDEVFVGRIRRDHSQPRTLNMWIVSDNLRKGAATNAVQTGEYLIHKGLL